MECGETTNCMLYDTKSLRQHLMYTTAFIMIIGVFFDVAVWYYCKDVLLFFPDKKEETEEGDIKMDENGIIVEGNVTIIYEENGLKPKENEVTSQL